jgi:hypothetical protein
MRTEVEDVEEYLSNFFPSFITFHSTAQMSNTI